ncbi:MAG: hypothetical protein IJW24_01815 [Clostridia bacterium]|nr:hypothetical protein [Clostridia bacterium]
MVKGVSKKAYLCEFVGPGVARFLESVGIKHVGDLEGCLARLGNFGVCGRTLKAKVLSPIFEAGFGIDVFVDMEQSQSPYVCGVLEMPISKLAISREVLKILANDGFSRVVDIANMTKSYVLDKYDGKSVSAFEILSQIKSGLKDAGIEFDEAKWGFVFDERKMKLAQDYDHSDRLIGELGLGSRFNEFFLRKDIVTIGELAASKEKIWKDLVGKSTSKAFKKIESDLVRLGVWEADESQK